MIVNRKPGPQPEFNVCSSCPLHKLQLDPVNLIVNRFGDRIRRGRSLGLRGTWPRAFLRDWPRVNHGARSGGI